MADKYNVEEVEALAKRALHLPITQATPIYEQLLSLYPTSARYWKQYVEAQMAINNDDATKQIFSRCLLTCLQVPLWQCYIRFIRKVYDKKGAEGQEETKKAFEFMLNYISIASLREFGSIFLVFILILCTCPINGGRIFASEEWKQLCVVKDIDLINFMLTIVANDTISVQVTRTCVPSNFCHVSLLEFFLKHYEQLAIFGLHYILQFMLFSLTGM